MGTGRAGRTRRLTWRQPIGCEELARPPTPAHTSTFSARRRHCRQLSALNRSAFLKLQSS
eukprot:487287-Prorocentrum_minimum.AAC.1